MPRPLRVVVALLLALAVLRPALAADSEGAETSRPSRLVVWLEGKHLGPSAVVLAIAMLPIFELRGSIPVAIWHYGMPWWKAFILSVIGNMLPIVPIILLIGPVSGFLMRRSRFWNRFFTWVFERSRRKGADLVERYEALGLAIFVAIPLPATGAWTGALIAFLLRIRARRALPAIFLGVLVAGIIVTVVVVGGLSVFRVFTKA